MIGPANEGEDASGDVPRAARLPQKPRPFMVTLRVYLLCGALIAAILWTIFFRVSTYAVAPGKILAVGDTKIVQPIEAGQVSAIRVKDGDSVKQGDVLVELNPTEAIAARTIIADKLVNLRAEMARRRVEISAARAEPVDAKASVAWDAAIPQKVREREDGVLASDLSQLAATIQDLEAKRKVKEAARDSASVSIVAEKSLIASTTEQLGMHQQLETKGWDSHARVLEALEPLKEQQVALATLQGNYADAVAAIPVIDGQIANARESFVTDDIQKLADAERQIEDLTQQLTKADRMLADMTLHAPIAGTIHATAVTSVGQAVSPGQQIMQVVPSDAELQVVAYVLNSDIGFVLEGQPAVIKVDTFPYTRYGVITGKVTKVATDAITGSDALNEQKNGSQPVSNGAGVGHRRSAANQRPCLSRRNRVGEIDDRRQRQGHGAVAGHVGRRRDHHRRATGHQLCDVSAGARRAAETRGSTTGPVIDVRRRRDRAMFDARWATPHGSRSKASSFAIMLIISIRH